MLLFSMTDTRGDEWIGEHCCDNRHTVSHHKTLPEPGIRPQNNRFEAVVKAKVEATINHNTDDGDTKASVQAPDTSLYQAEIGEKLLVSACAYSAH